MFILAMLARGIKRVFNSSYAEPPPLKLRRVKELRLHAAEGYDRRSADELILSKFSVACHEWGPGLALGLMPLIKKTTGTRIDSRAHRG